LQAGAVKLSPEQPFTWASGWKSPIYCDNRKLLSYPYIRDFIKSEMCNAIFERYPEAEVIAGVATAGIAWGAMAADQLKLPFVYVRTKAKDHGLHNQVEGYFEEGQQVVVVEDLVSTGKSSLQVIDVLRTAGVKVIGLVSIFNYGFSDAEEAFKAAEVDTETLTSYESLIKLALEKKIVSPETENMLKSWRENPSEWGFKS
jgi:orotate phosphoribosyltransferase